MRTAILRAPRKEALLARDLDDGHALKESLAMLTKVLTSGRVRYAQYEPASRQLELHCENKSVLACMRRRRIDQSA
jgi:hypothetical protein